MHGGNNVGAPLGNSNAFEHGVYSAKAKAKAAKQFLRALSNIFPG